MPCLIFSIFVCALSSISAEFLRYKVASVDTVVMGYERSGSWVNLFNVVTCSLPYYHIYFFLPWYLCLSLQMWLFCKIYIYILKCICCKLFFRNKLLTYLLTEIPVIALSLMLQRLNQPTLLVHSSGTGMLTDCWLKLLL